jgi:hypothetical protein
VHATTARVGRRSGRDGTVAVVFHSILLRLRLRPGERLLAGRHDVCVVLLVSVGGCKIDCMIDIVDGGEDDCRPRWIDISESIDVVVVIERLL